MRYIAVVIAVMLIPISECYSSDTNMNGDYNFGFLVGAVKKDPLAAVTGNTEFAIQGITDEKHHLYTADMQVQSFVGLSLNRIGKPKMNMRLSNYTQLGIQAYRFIPLNITLDDVSLTISGRDSYRTSFIGTSAVLPLLLKDQRIVSYVSLGYGYRANSFTGINATAVDLCARYMSDKMSLRTGLIRTMHNENETCVLLMIAVLSVFQDRDQIALTLRNSVANEHNYFVGINYGYNIF